MSARDLMKLTLFLGFAACSGPVADDTKDVDADADADADSDSDTDTTETGNTGPTGFEPAVLRIEGDFGYNAANRQVRAYTAPGGAYTVEPGLVLTYGNAQWLANGLDPADTGNYCIIILPITDSAQAAWAAADPTIWVGFNYTDAPALTSCNVDDNIWDPNVFGPDPVGDIVGYGGYGLGVGEIAAEWAPYTSTTSYYTDTFVGGYVASPLIQETWGFLTLPIVVDANFEAQSDGTSFTLMAPSAVFTGNNIATGAYRLITLFYWNLGP